MSDHSFELQKTIFTTLNGDSTITSTFSATVHDHVPQGTSFPYIVIGEETMTDESSATDVHAPQKAAPNQASLYCQLKSQSSDLVPALALKHGIDPNVNEWQMGKSFMRLVSYHRHHKTQGFGLGLPEISEQPHDPVRTSFLSFIQRIH